jgi:hypothetical protein
VVGTTQTPPYPMLCHCPYAHVKLILPSNHFRIVCRVSANRMPAPRHCENQHQPRMPTCPMALTASVTTTVTYLIVNLGVLL